MPREKRELHMHVNDKRKAPKFLIRRLGNYHIIPEYAQLVTQLL